MSKRDDLVDAMGDLLWENGYTATSPADVLRRSGAGQGSFYHHFSGKAELAAASLETVSARMRDDVDALLDAETDPLEALVNYLRAERPALRGCRLGRMAAEPAIDNPAIRQPIAEYFTHLEGSLARALERLRAAGRLAADASPDDLAATLAAVVQGGYVLARTRQDPGELVRAQRGAAALLLIACH